MLEPRALTMPYESDTDRANAIYQLIELYSVLDDLRAAAFQLPALAPHVRVLVSQQPFQPGDSAELRLQRWASIFASDLDAIGEVRNRIVHGTPVSDFDLRAAVWLARQLTQLIADPRNQTSSA